MINLTITNVLVGMLIYILLIITCILLVCFEIIPSIHFTNSADDNNFYTRLIILIGGIFLLGSSMLLIYPIIKD